MCVRERDIKAKPSVTKSPPHQAPFAPQAELLRRAAALLRPEKCPALQPCARRHHLTPGDIGAATAGCAAASRRLAKSGTAAMCVPPPRHARGHWRCSRRCAAASRCLEKCLALRPCVRRRHVMPGDIGAAAAAALLHLDSWQNPGTAAMCAPPPRHARGHWAAAS